MRHSYPEREDDPTVGIHDHVGRLALTRSIEPFELGALAACLLYGTVGSIWYDRATGTALRDYPGFGGRVFLLGLVVGATAALLGLARNTLDGLRTERNGLRLLFWLGLAYTVWAPFSSAGWRGLGLMVFMGGIAWVPALFVARRRSRQIAAAETALDGARPKG